MVISGAIWVRREKTLKYLINNYEIIFYHILIEISKIICKDISYSAKKLEIQ